MTLEKDKNITKSVFSVDYYKAKNKDEIRYKLFSYLMETRNTLLQINTNMTVSLKPSQDRDIIMKFRDYCENDNFAYSLNPIERNSSSGVLGKFMSRDENKIPAYDFLMHIPSGSLNMKVFGKYMNTYFFRAGIGFQGSDYENIISDYKSGLFSHNNFYTRFEYDLFDAFEFNHIKLITDKLDKNDFNDKIFINKDH